MSVYRAFCRLEEEKMVDTKRDTKNTSFYICNWKKYQSQVGHDVGHGWDTDPEEQEDKENTVHVRAFKKPKPKTNTAFKELKSDFRKYYD